MREAKVSVVVDKPLSVLVEETGEKHFVLESKLKGCLCAKNLKIIW